MRRLYDKIWMRRLYDDEANGLTLVRLGAKAIQRLVAPSGTDDAVSDTAETIVSAKGKLVEDSTTGQIEASTARAKSLANQEASSMIQSSAPETQIQVDQVSSQSVDQPAASEQAIDRAEAEEFARLFSTRVSVFQDLSR